MKRRKLLAGAAVVLTAVLILLFVYPHQMIAPGALIPAHTALQQDCFACHSPWRGASSARCVSCHVPARIGRTTTRGVPLSRSQKMPAFHAKLREAECLACHTDHAAILLTKTEKRVFDHGQLQPGIAGQCALCHDKPKDGLHKAVSNGCAQCHVTGAWKPANFAHDRYFKLDAHHDVACATCHKGNQFKAYTCYGCHAHQPAQIIADHAEEGIRNIENCAHCHRSASDERDEHESSGRGDD